MISFLWNIIVGLFDRSNDPVHSCDVYKNIGCSHVDGMLCDMRNCPILNEYKQGKDV